MTCNNIVQYYNSINSPTSQEATPQFYIQARSFDTCSLWDMQDTKRKHKASHPWFIKYTLVLEYLHTTKI